MRKRISLVVALGIVAILAGMFAGVLSVGHEDSHNSSIAGLFAPTEAAAAEAKQQYTCGMHPMIITDEPGLCPICNMDLTPLKTDGGSAEAASTGERKIKYWVAPMDPTFIRDEPGKSPMGMDLVPVYEDESATGSIISIDPVTSQNMGVRMTVAKRKNLSRTVRTVGLVGYEEPKQYSVNSKIDGWVERLYVNETGQFVKKGAPLLEIYSPALVSAQEEFLLARDNSKALAASPFPSISEGAKRLFESSKRRLKLWDISDRQIKNLGKSGKVRRTLTLYAPSDGIVTMKMVREGQFIKGGMELLMLNDISKVWVYADIYEYELPWVKVGQKARIILPYVGREPIESEISTIYPYVDPKTRTIKARFDIDNPDFTLKPDMYVNVRIETEPVTNALTVPVEAVLHSGERQTVFVVLGDGKFEPRQVKTGVQGESGDIEIIQGLLDGDHVVTSAQFMLDSESKLREAIQKMLNPKKPSTAEHAGHDMAAKDESLDDLFADDEEEDDESLESLFEEDDSDEEKAMSEK